MNILTVVDWPEQGSWIWGHLPAHNDRYDIVSLSGVRTARSALERATLYPMRYLWAGSHVLPRLNGYDVVFSWEVKCGFPIAFYQTLARQQRPRHVILGFIFKGILTRYPALFRWVFSSTSGVVCFTSWEREICHKVLRFPRERIHFVPLAWDVEEDNGVSPAKWDDYILSVGSSSRDYQTLLRVAERIGERFIVVARPYNLNGLTIPPNVEVHLDISSGEVTHLLRRARLVVVPLQDADYAAGQCVVLRAMSAARAVVVTHTPGTQDYVRDGETGVFVSPNNVEEMAEAIERLLSSPETTKSLGMQARQEVVARYSFAAMSRHLSGLAHSLVEMDTIAG